MGRKNSWWRRRGPISPSKIKMSAEVVDAEIYQIALLIDELKHTELQCRTGSMQKLAQIGEHVTHFLPNPLSPALHA